MLMRLAVPLDTDHIAQCLIEQYDSIIPERKLLVAVLIRAIADALCSTGRCRNRINIMREAWAWIVVIPFRSTPRVMSFQWVCESLELCPEKIRKIVINAKRSAKKMHRPGGRSVNIFIT